MILNTLKADVRKILTIRSTYFLVGIGLLLTLIFSFWFEGYKGSTGSGAATLSPGAFKEIIANSSALIAAFISIIAILSICHEYRYNTILYAFTSNVKRTQVLLSKVITVALFSLVVGFLCVGVAIGSYLLGLELRGANLPTQNIDVMTELGKMTAYFLGYGLMGLLIGFIIRSVVGAIAFFFIVPAAVEGLLSVILKEKAVYLPFSSLDNIMGHALMQNNVSPSKSILVVSFYLVVGWFVAWLLFLKRDAN